MAMTKEEKEERKNTVERLLKEGLSVKEIAERTGISKSTVCRVIIEMAEVADG